MSRALIHTVIFSLFALALVGVFVFANRLRVEQASAPNVSQNELLALGQRTYQASCASCHGENGVGYAGAQTAPAINGSEHAWHHPDEQILDLIRQGGNKMPAVGADWSYEKVEAVWAYVKQWWTPQQREAQQGDIGENF